MKIFINVKEHEFPPGTKMSTVVEMVRESKRDEPMIKTMIEKTGQDHIVYILNGRVVKPYEYEELELHENDDIRWIHPYFGG